MSTKEALEAAQYATRDHIAQGDYYLRHVSAMTAEGLHAKSAIAAELAHRDIEIERLRTALAEQRAEPSADARKPVQWPVGREAGRAEDMGEGYLRIVLDNDNDVCVAVWDGKRSAGVEFCNPGACGGGRSSRTRMALIALMVAIEADNAERPELQRPSAAMKGTP